MAFHSFHAVIDLSNVLSDGWEGQQSLKDLTDYRLFTPMRAWASDNGKRLGIDWWYEERGYEYIPHYLVKVDFHFVDKAFATMFRVYWSL